MDMSDMADRRGRLPLDHGAKASIREYPPAFPARLRCVVLDGDMLPLLRLPRQ